MILALYKIIFFLEVVLFFGSNSPLPNKLSITLHRIFFSPQISICDFCFMKIHYVLPASGRVVSCVFNLKNDFFFMCITH